MRRLPQSRLQQAKPGHRGGSAALAFAILVAVGPRTPAGAVRTGSRPLTEPDVIYLIENYRPLNGIQEIVSQLGIDFQLTPSVATDLKRAGATPGLLEAMGRLTPVPADLDKPQHKPLTENDVLYLLRNSVPTRRVEIIASQLGISFELNLIVEHDLLRGGATVDLLESLDRSGHSTLLVQSNPPGAHVSVDGRSFENVGSGPIIRLSPLAPGVHRLRLTLPSHLAYEQDIALAPAKTTQIAVNLVPLQPPKLAAPPMPVATYTDNLGGFRSPPPDTTLVASAKSMAPPPDVRTQPAPVAALNRSSDFLLARTLTGHQDWVTAVAFSADGRLLASGSWDRTVKLWDLATGREMRTLASQTSGIEAIAFSPDGRWLASEGSDKAVHIWDAATGKDVRVLASRRSPDPLDENWDYSLAFSPDGRWLAFGSDDKTVGLWEVATGREVREFTTHPRGVIYVAFSHDGHWLASGDDARTIDIWNASTGQKLRTLSGHSKDVYAVAFSPDNRWLASASGDKTVKLWDIGTGRPVRTFTGHTNRVTSVAFSPDGCYLASGGWDKTIRIWDAQSGRELKTLAGHGRSVYAIAFSPDGRRLASGSEDKTLKLWTLKGDTILARRISE